MDTRSSLLDDGWSSGRKNFTRLESENSVTPAVVEMAGNSRSTGWRSAVDGRVMGGAARGLDILGVLNELAQKKESIETTLKEMTAQRAAEPVREQLAPDQRATLLIDRDTGEMTLLHAGQGYLSAPNNKPFAFELKGDDEGICRGNEVLETRSFDVIDRNGQRRKLEFYEPWKPGFDRKDDKDDDRDPEHRSPLGHHNDYDEEEDES